MNKIFLLAGARIGLFKAQNNSFNNVILNKRFYIPVLFGLALFLAVFYRGSITGYFIEETGDDFDVGMCISDSYLADLGVDYDFAGSIGCPLGASGIPWGDGFDPHCEKIIIEEVVAQKITKTFNSGTRVNMALFVDSTACPANVNFEVGFSKNPPVSWAYSFECATDVNGTCGIPGKVLRIDTVNGQKNFDLTIDIPTFAPVGSYNLLVGSQRVI